MHLLIDHHHYKKELITHEDRVAIYERYVIDLLLSSKLSDNQRDSSIAFELKHHHSVAQFARILARKRNLPEDVCVVGALLHDISVIICGTYKNHAHESAEIAKEILDKLGLFSLDEKVEIIKIIYNHSDKDIFSADMFQEFGKDVDILDSFLYPNSFGYYLKNKRLNVFKCYIQRAISIWREIGLDKSRDFSVLENYDENWMDRKITSNLNIAREQLSILLQLIEESKERQTFIPSFVINSRNAFCTFYFNKKSYENFINNTKKTINPIFDFDLRIDSSYIIPKQIQDQNDIAIELLSKSQESFIIIWSAIDSYEILDIGTSSERILELGIKL